MLLIVWLFRIRYGLAYCQPALYFCLYLSADVVVLLLSLRKYNQR